MSDKYRYREFWIDHDVWYSDEEKLFNDRTCTPDEWNGNNLIHVIEKKAFDDLIKTIGHFEREQDRLYKLNDKLNNALDAIDDHLRQMHRDDKINLNDMIKALKVISDNLKENENG